MENMEEINVLKREIDANYLYASELKEETIKLKTLIEMRAIEIDALKAEVNEAKAAWLKKKRENATLKAENERLLKDAERYQHVRSVGGCVWHVTNNPSGYVLATGDIYDAAVDAAINRK